MLVMLSHMMYTMHSEVKSICFFYMGGWVVVRMGITMYMQKRNYKPKIDSPNALTFLCEFASHSYGQV